MDSIMCVVHNGAPSFYTFHTELSFVVGSSQNSLNLMKGVEIFRLNRNKPGQAAVLIKVRKQTSCVGMSWVSFGIQIICRAAASDQRGRRSQQSEQHSRPRCAAAPVSTVLTDYTALYPWICPEKSYFWLAELRSASP